MKTKTYTVIRTVKEYYQVEANSKKIACDMDLEDPYQIDVKSTVAYLDNVEESNANHLNCCDSPHPLWNHDHTKYTCFNCATKGEAAIKKEHPDDKTKRTSDKR